MAFNDNVKGTEELLRLRHRERHTCQPYFNVMQDHALIICRIFMQVAGHFIKTKFRYIDRSKNLIIY